MRRLKKKEELTSVLVLHHGDDRTGTVVAGNHDLVNKLSPTGRVRGDEGLLAHVGGELVTGHRHHLAPKLVDDQVPVLRLPMLENILDNIVL